MNNDQGPTTAGLFLFLFVASMLFWLVVTMQKAEACTQPGPDGADEPEPGPCDVTQPVHA